MPALCSLSGVLEARFLDFFDFFCPMLAKKSYPIDATQTDETSADATMRERL